MTDRFEDKLKRVLDADAGRLDSRTRRELASRRRAALDAAEAALPVPSRWWLPAGALAAGLIAALVLWPADQRLPAAVAVEDSALDMEILLAEESLELVEELEFFEWLGVAGDAG